MDAYAKQWRLFADIFNNVGVPLFKSCRQNLTAIAEDPWVHANAIRCRAVLRPPHTIFFGMLGYILELLSPVFPGAFIYLACLGSVARAVTGALAPPPPPHPSLSPFCSSTASEYDTLSAHGRRNISDGRPFLYSLCSAFQP